MGVDGWKRDLRRAPWRVASHYPGTFLDTSLPPLPTPTPTPPPAHSLSPTSLSRFLNMLRLDDLANPRPSCWPKTPASWKMLVRRTWQPSVGARKRDRECPRMEKMPFGVADGRECIPRDSYRVTNSAHFPAAQMKRKEKK